MGYYLQAVIGAKDSLKCNAPKDAYVVKVSEKLALLPFSDTFRESRNIARLAMTDAGHSEPTLNICEICKSLSDDAIIAYVDAEYFGGVGGQTCVKWVNGQIIETPTLSENAINDALRFLGVERTGKHDEFDEIGLSKYSDTNDWL